MTLRAEALAGEDSTARILIISSGLEYRWMIASRAL